ncbi:MAG: antitoxin HicB [Clostridia bacterium]|nr:antitoxin HicB [Clostridia bacterium]
MEKTMNYLGFTGSVEYSESKGMFVGKVLDVDAIVTYAGHTPEELRRAFEAAVEDYLDKLDEIETQDRD